MSSAAITTVMKMMESLSLDVQDRVAEHLREYIDDLQDVQNKKLLKGKRLFWTTTSYEVCCSSLLLG